MGQSQYTCANVSNQLQIKPTQSKQQQNAVLKLSESTKINPHNHNHNHDKEYSDMNKSQNKKRIEKQNYPVTKKCQFVYIKPVRLQTMDPHADTFTMQQNQNVGAHDHSDSVEGVEIREIGERHGSLKSSNGKKKEQNSNKSIEQKKELDKIGDGEDKANMEQILSSRLNQNNQQGQDINRILVQWSSFIKIKKKNYLEDYLHIKQIGQGAFGTVSKIKMKYGGMYRAAKIVKISAISKKKSQQQKFISQILIPMKTDHPNLNKLYQVFQWKNQYVLIMQLCQGGDLFNCIKAQKAFTQSKVADIMKQIISGVVYMHKINIVHRDLKPENMLYDTESRLLKIIDFGTAIELPPGKKLTSTIGTPYYIAPQVLAGQYNQKCDVWSCGVILYIMLSGTPPFTGRDQHQIMNNIRNQAVSFSNPIWNKRSKQCKKLVMQMLNRNYNQRLSAVQILNSQWINNSLDYQNKQLGIQAIKNLQTFQFQNKLKAVVYTYIASQLYSNKDKQKLLQCFRQIDQDGDGVIGKQQLVTIFKKNRNNSGNNSIDQSYIDKILKIVDTNGSGLIDFTQFLVAASNEEELLQKQRLQNAFSYLDTDHSGYITAQEIKPFLDNTEQTSEEIQKIFEQVDINGDGKISKKQFVSLLLKR